MAGGKKRKKTLEPDKQPKASLKEKFSEILDLPKEIVLNIPKLTIIGNGDMMLENYKSIIEYDDARIRINTGIGVVRITGSRLFIREITSEDIIICGEILGLEFVK
ncbi:MAG: sporulation protein YqfC [Ruminiclostridium sp.]|nr:sporulation protein YqfC [Ruminiclostridium sp.]